MSAEYNSNLISKLYNETDEKKLTQIADEMGELADSHFLYPLYDAFKKHYETSIPHYFLSAMHSIKSVETLKIAKLLLADQKIVKSHLEWILPILSKNNYFEESIFFIIKNHLQNIIYSDPDQLNEYDLSELVYYLKSANKIEAVEEELKYIFFEEAFEREVRTFALKTLLKMNAAKILDFLLEQYPRINDTDSEIILSKVIMSWKGSRVLKLKDLIMKGTNSRAKEILKQYEESKAQKTNQMEEEKAEVESTIFNNAKLVTDINDLRQRINISAMSYPGINIALFNESELLIKQLTIANNEADFRNRCMEFRDVIKQINETTREHNLTEEEISKVLPDVDVSDYSKPLNQLYLFLFSRKIPIDPELFNLRPINRLVNLFSHPDEQKDLLKLLQKMKLLEYYKNQNWAVLHKKILENYKAALEKLLRTLSQSKS